MFFRVTIKSVRNRVLAFEKKILILQLRVDFYNVAGARAKGENNP